MTDRDVPVSAALSLISNVCLHCHLLDAVSVDHCQRLSALLQTALRAQRIVRIDCKAMTDLLHP